MRGQVQGLIQELLEEEITEFFIDSAELRRRERLSTTINIFQITPAA